MTKSGAERLLNAERWGFWTRTKKAPFRAVRWEAELREDGQRSFHGKNWVEVLPYGEKRDPGRFYTADVESAGPHEWLDYYPALDEPVCGWGRPRLPAGEMQYCPRKQAEDQPFCQKHMHELLDDTEERNLSGEDEPGTGGESVSAPERVAGDGRDAGDGVRLDDSPGVRPQPSAESVGHRQVQE